jgi:tetratricopeptide (TPR) repeat protein
MEMGKPEQTERLIDKVLEEDESNLGASLLRARLLLKDRKFGEAQEILEGITKDRPRHGHAHHYLGLAYMGENERTKAKGALLKAVEYGPGNLRARMLLAELFLGERAVDLAQAQLKVVLTKEPGNYIAHVLQGNAYALKRDVEKARQAYSKAAELRPDDPVPYYQLATLDRAQGRYDGAMAHLDKVLALKADHVPAIAAKTSVYMARKQPGQALSFLGEQLRQHEKNTQLAAMLHQMRGDLLLVQKDYEQSEGALKKALDLNPDMVAPYVSLAKLYLAKKETNKAISVYEDILKKQPRFIQAHMALGAIYQAAGNQKEACEMYEKALEINPDFAPAANNLAWNLLQQRENLDRAFDLARRAKAKLPDDPSVADTLGLAFIAKGLYPSAISELSDAAEKLPQNQTILYHLSLAHWKNGERDQALRSLRHALKVKGAFPERQEATELLKEIEGS